MSDGTRLEVAIRHRIGPLMVDVAFTLIEPWTTLFAPSGAGKSTVLRVIAGLLQPDAGCIVCGDGMVLLDTAAGVNVPARRRQVRFVGQQAGLFPHRSVRQNVAYGMGGSDPGEVMEMCRVEHLARKMPAALSGGERQRVALARALGAMPARMVLLDEPFSGLDMELRDYLLGEIRVWLAARNVPVLHVTHDIGEVFAIRPEVLRMREGKIVARGAVDIVLRDERDWLAVQLGTKRG